MFPPAVPAVEAAEVPAGSALLDVREVDEWDAGHIEGALHIPLGELPARLDEVPDGDPLVIVCRSGQRSARAVAWLGQNGVQALNLEGGMRSWAAAGLPMVSETGEAPAVR
jgi:rhodanese-related sulfurtransferase